jgi:hypothetical protein
MGRWNLFYLSYSTGSVSRAVIAIYAKFKIEDTAGMCIYQKYSSDGLDSFSILLNPKFMLQSLVAIG